MILESSANCFIPNVSFKFVHGKSLPIFVEYRNSTQSVPLVFHLFHVPSRTNADMVKHGGLFPFGKVVRSLKLTKIL